MTEDAKIFLLDLNPAMGLGRTLLGVIESSEPSLNLEIQLQEEPQGVHGPGSSDDKPFASEVESRAAREYL